MSGLVDRICESLACEIGYRIEIVFFLAVYHSQNRRACCLLVVVGIQEQIESLRSLGGLESLGWGFELASGLRNLDLFFGEDPAGLVLYGAVLRRISFSFQHQEEFL